LRGGKDEDEPEIPMRYQMGSGEGESGCIVLLKEQLDCEAPHITCIIATLYNEFFV
tara:strand:- start:211 stop:378 length:168 start_codon:yes stop_codon:yes gene_type:complete